VIRCGVLRGTYHISRFTRGLLVRVTSLLSRPKCRHFVSFLLPVKSVVCRRLGSIIIAFTSLFAALSRFIDYKHGSRRFDSSCTERYLPILVVESQASLKTKSPSVFVLAERHSMKTHHSTGMRRLLHHVLTGHVTVHVAHLRRLHTETAKGRR
jgi:hypothetical protein